MKQFRFKLDPVIRYRRYLERLALMELAKAKNALILTKKKIKGLEQAKAEAAKDLGLREERGVEVGLHRVYAMYLKGLDEKISLQRERIEEIGRAIKEKYEAAEVERIRKETLEAVRETGYRRYIQAIDHAEQKAADELVNLRRGNRITD